MTIVTEENRQAEITIDSKQSLGWGRFLLQFFSVAVIYLLAQVPPVLIWGKIDAQGNLDMPSEALAGATAFGMAVALFVSWLWLRKDKAVARAWNLSAPTSWPRTLLIALAATIAIIAWFALGSMALTSVGLEVPQVAIVLDMVTQSAFHYVLWVVLVAWFAAGFGEELLYRGFLMDRLQQLKGVGSSFWAPIVIQALIFGISHGYQSLSGVILTGIIGLGLGWLRMRCGGSLLACIFAHMAVDTFSMSVAFAETLALPAG